VDDPIILKAIEEKAIIVIIQGQSVNASNGNTQNGSLKSAIKKLLNSGKTRNQILDEVDRNILEESMTISDGNITKAAQITGYRRSSFHRRMVQLGMNL